MSKISPELRAFLMDTAHTGKIATVRADGRPHVVPIWYAMDDENRIYFNTGRSTVKAKNIRRDPRVSICVDDEKPPFSFAVLEGTAEFIESKEVLLEWATRIGGRYMGSGRAEEFGKRNAVDGEETVRVTIIHVQFQKDMAE